MEINLTYFGAGNETRTRDLNLGKVALYQLSYSRPNAKRNCRAEPRGVKKNQPWTGETAPEVGAGGPSAPVALHKPPLPRSSGQASLRYWTMDHRVSTVATAVSPKPIR